MGVGLAAGLVVSWWLWPVEYTDMSPDTLHPYHRAEYIKLISHAYAYDKDLRRAQVRLAALGELGSVGVEVVTLAEQYAAQGKDVHDIESLARLAHALGHRRAALAPFMPGGAPTPTWTPWPTATPTATEVPTATPTPIPTSTPTSVPSATPSATSTLPRFTPSVRITQTLTVEAPTATQTRNVTPTGQATPTTRPTLTPTITTTPEPRFVLTAQERRCDGDAGVGGLLRVTVFDSRDEPMPNVELLIRWDDGEDRFFTGLKPERGVGYADYALAADESYQVGIVGLVSDFAQDIVSDACDDSTRASWNLIFRLQDGGR